MLLVGAKPPGRNTEQHDVFFSIGQSIQSILPEVQAFWPEAKRNIHLDAWREVTLVDGSHISVVEKPVTKNTLQLYFINLGGYKQNEFEEFHYKILIAAPNKSSAIVQAKRTAFFQHTGFKAAKAHIDDKYGIDVDDVYAIPDILPQPIRQHYNLLIEPATDNNTADVMHLGYFKLSAVHKWAPKESNA